MELAMINLHDIRYLRIGTPDLDQTIKYMTEIIGLQLARREGKTAYFRSDKVEVRGDTRDHTLAYFEGDPADQSIAFELRNPGELEAVAVELEKAGRPVRLGTKEECEQRHVRGMIASTDPSGNKIEFVARPFHTGQRFFPSRDAGITEFSHIGLFSTDCVRDEKFWTTICNARVSDWYGDIPFLRINTAHHSVVLFPSPKGRIGINHVNHQVEDVDDVMRSYYFLKHKGVKILQGPGRHPISGATMVYFEGPDGLTYEYSVGVKHILPEQEASYRPRQFGMTQINGCMHGSSGLDNVLEPGL